MSSNNKRTCTGVVRLAGAAIVAMAASTTPPAFAQSALAPIKIGPPSTEVTLNEGVVTISNHGGGALTLGRPQFPAGFEAGAPVARPCGETLPAGEECELSIRFAPVKVGEQSGTLTIATNDPLHPLLSVHLSGKGVPRPDRSAGSRK